MELTAEQKTEIDNMPIESMLSKWRFAKPGTFQNGDPWTEYFQQVLFKKRDADPEAWTRASKSVGW